MANVPDLMTLLSLGSRQSQSPFGGQHKTILIERDYCNAGDFVFLNILQHFARREPDTRILLVTLHHDWTNYSAAAAKCGFNIRRSQNMGNIDVINIMSLYYESLKSGQEDSFNPCKHIKNCLSSFLADGDHSARDNTVETEHDQSPRVKNSSKPSIIMIDDLSSLLLTGASHDDVISLICNTDKLMREQSLKLQPDRCNLFVLQTIAPLAKPKDSNLSTRDSQLSQLTMNLKNFCDLNIILRPLETGHSTRVDGTIRIIDNRLPARTKPAAPSVSGLTLLGDTSIDIGTNKAFFFKLSDRRVRLTTSALIF